MNIEDYRAVRINDCGDENVSYGVIMLNNKHTIKEFQQAINEVKNKYFDEGELDWQVDDILADERLNEFDWFELPSDCDDYVEV